VTTALLHGLLASSLAGIANAASFPRAVTGDGFISIPIDWKERVKSSSSIQARNPFEVALDNQITFYTIEST
jgi:hypothetical protein